MKTSKPLAQTCIALLPAKQSVSSIFQTFVRILSIGGRIPFTFRYKYKFFSDTPQA